MIRWSRKRGRLFDGPLGELAELLSVIAALSLAYGALALFRHLIGA